MAARDNLPDVPSSAALLALALALGGEAELRYAALADHMRRLHNTDAAAVFDRLAAAESDRADAITAEAQGQGIDLAAVAVPLWRPEEDETISSLQETDYLMTPYKALRLAVLDKQQAFTLWSALAAQDPDSAVGQRAEAMARDLLDVLPELRTERRRAYRDEPRAAITRAALSDRPVSAKQVHGLETEVDALLAFAIAQARSALATHLSDVAANALDQLQRIFAVAGAAGPAARGGVAAPDTVAKLKDILREFEAAVDLFLRIAETGRTEAIVAAAHDAVERYLGGLAVVRDQLDYLIHREGAPSR